MTTQISVKGKKIFHPSLISWSYLYLGKVALTQRNTKRIRKTLIKNQKIPGIAFKGNISIGGYQPPRNKMTVKELIKIIFAYSAKKNKPNDIDEYSVKNPATNVASSSGKSKGNLFVSASADIINTTNMGKRGIANHIFF